MPSGLMPTYSYRPPLKLTEPAKLRTCSSRRARLWVGGNTEDSAGSYFRVREPGLHGNRISLELIEYEPEVDAVLVVTNHNISYDENVVGPAKTEYLDLQAKSTDLWVINNLTTTPHTHYYSISFKISFSLPSTPTADLGPFAFDKLFSKDKLAVQLSLNTLQATSNSIISIAHRHKIYRLTWGEKIVVDQASGLSTITHGWDIADLRTQINGSDPWIEMKERTPPAASDTSGLPGVRPDLIDAQDEGEDGDWLYPFPETFFSGGDGLPDNPTTEQSGPTRSIVHVNYGEKPDGTLGEANLVYEWAGDTVKAGSWKLY